MIGDHGDAYCAALLYSCRERESYGDMVCAYSMCSVLRSLQYSIVALMTAALAITAELYLASIPAFVHLKS